MVDSIAVIDFGSQYAQLIARRVREAQVYCQMFPWDVGEESVMAIHPKGFILSGGPASIYEPDAPQLPTYILQSGLPILGICYGMQALTHALRGKVSSSSEREYGQARLQVLLTNPLLVSKSQKVWMSHGDRIDIPPDGFQILARSDNSPVAAIGEMTRGYYGVQFHPEVNHTPGGFEILRRFVVDVCGTKTEWTPQSIILEGVNRIKALVEGQRVLSAVSGGVDSTVATAMVHRAIGEQLIAIFVDTGLLRQGESLEVVNNFERHLGVELVSVDASSKFMQALRGVTEPEKKRRIIGDLFIKIFEAQAKRLGKPRYLVQGTIYPDVVESRAPDRSKAQRIKTHHNVGGLPEEMDFELVEPLRYLFKDEVRAVGKVIGLPAEMLWRQPFPGPGLAVRCLGEVTPERLARLRAADHILISELDTAGLLCMETREGESRGTAQAFAVLLPVRSVGVMGDQRTYQETVVLRAVTTQDFMTADWARLPYNLVGRISNRIVNEVAGINRVVYDVTSKPPATIEWE